MRLILPALLLLTFSCVLGASAQTNATPTQSSWTSLATGQALTLTLQDPKNLKLGAPVAVVVYLKNLAAPRLGTESDEIIINNFLAAGYLVVSVDFAHHPRARVPYLNRDLGKLRDDIRNKKLLEQYFIDNTHIYFVPAGHRLLRDVVYYRDEKRTLALDVIYPSKPTQPVGTVLEFSCDNKDRMGNLSLSICSDTLLDGEATEGFAAVMADHPVAAQYKGIDPMPDCAQKIKAAIRTVRAIGPELSLSGKIVPVGFSRGSGMALMLLTTEGMSEFEGHGEHPSENSSVQGAVVMSGRFTYLDLLPDDRMKPRYEAAWGDRKTHQEIWRRHGALDYLQQKTLPLFLTINCTESPDALHQMETLRKRLTALGSEATFMLDPEPRGHKVTLVPEILAAMNEYLKTRLN